MMQVNLLTALVLLLALASAVWHDVRTRRIPNRLILLGTAAALVLHGLPGGRGICFSLAGCAVGLALLLPFYALRTLGAGDVKLMAMVGAFLGYPGVIGATLLAMLAGGVLALAVAAWSGKLAQVMKNVQHMLRVATMAGLAAGMSPEANPALATGKLPYAVAIACGTACQLLLAGTPGWTIFS